MASQTNKVQYEKARLYADINVRKGPSWHEYENTELEFENPDNYEIVRKLGRGKYSEVYEGINTQTDNKCVLKILKPIRGSKVKREIKILQNLAGGANVVRLQNVVRDPASKTTSLVFEYVNNKDYKQLYPTLSVADLSFYMLQILKGLDYCHSNGIMHRDIKPQNIMIDPDQRSLRIIDWGLAEFYFPGKQYNVRVASRYFKGPELLIDYPYYDYSLDMWSLGAMFAGIIFMKDPFFMGANNQDQLDKIARVLGTKELMQYLKHYKLKLSSKYDNILGQHTKKPFESFLTEQNRRLATPQAIDLLSKMLVYDHATRILPKQAMKHPYFKGLQ